MKASIWDEDLEQLLLRHPAIGDPVVEQGIQGVGDRFTWDSGRLLLQIDLDCDEYGSAYIEWYFRDHRTKDSDAGVGMDRLEEYVAKIADDRRSD